MLRPQLDDLLCMFYLDTACEVLYVFLDTFMRRTVCYVWPLLQTPRTCFSRSAGPEKKMVFVFLSSQHFVLQLPKRRLFGRAGGKLAYVCTLAATLHAQFALTCMRISFTVCIDIHIPLFLARSLLTLNPKPLTLNPLLSHVAKET